VHIHINFRPPRGARLFSTQPVTSWHSSL